LRFPVTDLAARAEALARVRRVQVVLALLVLLYASHHAARSMGDFKVYRLAALRAVAGESVYRLSDPHRYLYAPVVTFLFFPLAVLPPLAGKILWLAFNFAILVSIFRMTAAVLFPNGRAPPGFHALLLLLSFRFIDNNLGHGQTNILLLWLVLEAYRLAANRRHQLAGLALAAAIAIKIIPFVFLLQIVLRRQWRFAAWTVLGLCLLAAIPLLWWGSVYPQLLRQWVGVVVDQVGHYEMGNKINQSISAFTYRLFRPHPGGAPLLELAPAVVAGVTAVIHLLFVIPMVMLSLRLAAGSATERRRLHGDELSLYLLYSTVAAPYSWKYYFANLIFPFGSALGRLWGRDRRRFEAGLAVVFALNLLAGLELLGKRLSTTFQLWSFHFLGACVLFSLLADAAFRSGPTEDEAAVARRPSA
jgi:alpha-1,2-mannosyltransferase